MSSAVSTPKKSRGLLLGAVTALLIGYCAYSQLTSISVSGDTVRAFFGALKEGQDSTAYSYLSSRRRAVMSPEAFQAFTDHAAFRSYKQLVVRPPDAEGDGWCFLGYATTNEGDWGYQVFIVEDHGQPKIHSLALQPPTSMMLGTMLEECGFWEGTMVGYAGPPVERRTPPTS